MQRGRGRAGARGGRSPRRGPQCCFSPPPPPPARGWPGTAALAMALPLPPPAGLGARALQALCRAGGCLEQGELQRCLAAPPEELARELRDARRFVLASRPGPGPGPVVVAASAVRLCPEPLAGCAGACGRLHLCRFFVYGCCRNQRAGKECKFIHNLRSEHNLPVLKHHGLQCLNDRELCQLLLQNDPSLLPEICPHYNRGDGPHGSCNFKTICIKLHICQHYLLGDCRFGSNCKRSHDIFNPECYEKLEKRGMTSDLINRLPSIFRNMYDIKNGNSSPTKVKGDSLNEVSTIPNNNEKLEEICLYHIRGSCSFLDKCIREHFHLPYRWQICDGAEWKDLKDMEKIEEAYCDPRNNSTPVSSSVSALIKFQTMTCDSRKIRRLSTESSVTKPPHYILTTEWVWYWKDEYGLWLEYGKQDVDHAAATVCSSDLEKAYLAKESPTVLQFKAGKHEYEINFKDMVQKNLRYKTEREICRRPKFISPQEVEKKKISGNQHSGEWKNIPDHWDKSVLPEVGYKLIKLLSSSEEYKKIQTDFQRTMPKTAILCIQRIQNPSLWELYQWQKEQMHKRNAGKAVAEKFLFHGTSKQYVDAICQQNFDWRVCGLNGTVYGKGSYFARDASYSDNYSKCEHNVKTMFLARVLVGEFTCGNSSYRLPPPKSGQNSYYDSCVNSTSNPSIFVIFEKYQIYPEYLIEYTDQPLAAKPLSAYSFSSYLQ